MTMRIIGAIGFLLRLVGLFFGVAWLLIGIMDVSGLSHDEKKMSGPGFIGFAVFTLAVVFAFSMRKRRAKQRAAARKTGTIVGEVQKAMKTMREELIREAEKQLDEQNVTDPAQR